jgi:hypothetical protein
LSPYFIYVLHFINSFLVSASFLITSFASFSVPLSVIHVDTQPSCQLLVQHGERSVAYGERRNRKPRCMLVRHSLPIVPVAAKPIKGAQIGALSHHT